MVGVRVLLGSQDVSRVPSFIEIFGRSLPVSLTRSRWFDFPLTRDESLQADKKLTITFGPSLDAGKETSFSFLRATECGFENWTERWKQTTLEGLELQQNRACFSNP